MNRCLLLLEDRGQCTACTMGEGPRICGLDPEPVFHLDTNSLEPSSSTEPGQQLDSEGDIWCRGQWKSSGYQESLSWVS